MKTRSHVQRRTNTESSDRVVANIQPRAWGKPHVQQPPAKHDFSHVDLFSHAPQRGAVQAKLTVGAPNDVYEQEADRVAEQVVSMPDSAVQQSVQREAVPQEEELQMKALGNSVQRENVPEEELQMKPLAAAITPLVQREEIPEEEKLQAKSLETSIQREATQEEEEELQMKPLATETLQREKVPEEEEIQAKSIGNSVIQREEIPEEEEIQTKALGNSIQREAMPEEEEEIQTKLIGNATLQREAMPEEEIQTKRSPDAGSQAGSNLESRLSSSQGGGSPLSEEVRSFMEPRFGADFSQVRVHTGGESVQMNQDINAQAFTHKQDVYFGAGKAPGNDELTAHELTHVVQQTGNVQMTEAEVLQRKEHPVNLSGGGYLDDSKFDVTTKAFMSPENEKPTTLNVEDGATATIRGEELLKGGSKKGTISFQSHYEVLRDDSFLSGGDKKKSDDFTSTFDYSVGADNTVLISQDPDKAATTDLRDIFQIEDQDSNKYEAYVLKSLKGSGLENIHQRVSLLFNEKKVEQSSTATTKTNTAANAGVNGKFSAGLSTKLTLQLDANGNDILMLLGGAKLLKGGLSVLKKSKVLEKVVGNLGEGLTEALKKQTLSYNLTQEMAAQLAAEFGLEYKYQKDVEETERISSAFTTGGTQAQEVHQIQILQSRQIGDSVFFEKEDQGELSLTAKQSIDSFITPYVPEILRVGSRLKVNLLEGRGSRTGTKDHNKTLGEIRANKVKEHLMIRHGLQEENFVTITSKGNDKANQVFTDASDRRVNIRLVEQ